MVTLYTQQDKNVRKTWLLMAIFFVLVIFLGYFLRYYYNNPGILYLAVIFSVGMNWVSYWWSDKIVLSMYHARPATESGEHDLINIVENLSITSGLPAPKVFIIEDSAPNAFATGRDKNHSTVAVTSGLLRILNKAELEGVVAHELAHVGNRDILLSTVVVTLVGLVSIASDIFVRSTFFGGKRDSREGGNVLMIVGIVLMILSPIVAKLIQLAISRKREFLADASGALLTRYPDGLASALQKISGYSGPMQRANNATAHLFIASPFGPKVSGLSKLFMTHPPVEERIAALLGNK